eukprot:CAMPEP_0202400286 /NCGR_PEP_ID=MMETSP1128-20130828/2615_1 /ASSEMBLY_ACC=CAM_ASM_000463 /TAXON_ID=3047 /ORGANISM="Dunaliella tertiolecta, Strain CCMP1320" /LENGTH=80 /DNA_ID=CAMNT_0049003795 /DNA_START=77 /DNA_END=316 /DNA_ORIENTATION=-
MKAGGDEELHATASSQGLELPLTSGQHEQPPHHGAVAPPVQTLYPLPAIPSPQASHHAPPAENHPTLTTQGTDATGSTVS